MLEATEFRVFVRDDVGRSFSSFQVFSVSSFSSVVKTSPFILSALSPNSRFPQRRSAIRPYNGRPAALCVEVFIAFIETEIASLRSQ